jgi:hypothetical protein
VVGEVFNGGSEGWLGFVGEETGGGEDAGEDVGEATAAILKEL